MSDRINIAVKHPVVLEPRQMDLFSDDVAIVAEDAQGNRLTIVASRARWMEALTPRFGPKPSAGEVARDMYLRGEIEVEDFETALDRRPLP